MLLHNIHKRRNRLLTAVFLLVLSLFATGCDVLYALIIQTEPPANVKAVILRPNMVVLDWDEPVYVSNPYCISRTQAGSDTSIQLSSTFYEATYTDTKNLDPGTTYTYSIQAHIPTVSGGLVYSDEVKITVTVPFDAEGAIPRPLNVTAAPADAQAALTAAGTAAGASSSGVSITWDTPLNVDENDVTYQIFWKKETSSEYAFLAANILQSPYIGPAYPEGADVSEGETVCYKVKAFTTQAEMPDAPGQESSFSPSACFTL